MTLNAIISLTKDTLMATSSPDSLKATEGKRLFAPWVWIPLLVGVGSLGLLLLASVFRGIDILAWPALAGAGATLLYILVQGVARLLERRWNSEVMPVSKPAVSSVWIASSGVDTRCSMCRRAPRR